MTSTNDGCPRFRDEWIERGAPPPEAAEHARSCPSCRAALAEHEATWAILGRASGVPEASPDFRERVWARIDAADRARRRRLAARLAAVALAAAAVLLLLTRRPGGGETEREWASPPDELLANLDLYENLDFIEASGEELDWIAAMASELGDAFVTTDGDANEE